MIANLAKRIKEEEQLLRQFHATNSFFIKGMVGVGKSSFVFDLVHSFESFGYTFHYSKATNDITVNMFLLETITTLKLNSKRNQASFLTFFGIART